MSGAGAKIPRATKTTSTLASKQMGYRLGQAVHHDELNCRLRAVLARLEELADHSLPRVSTSPPCLQHFQGAAVGIPARPSHSLDRRCSNVFLINRASCDTCNMHLYCQNLQQIMIIRGSGALVAEESSEAGGNSSPGFVLRRMGGGSAKVTFGAGGGGEASEGGAAVDSRAGWEGSADRLASFFLSVSLHSRAAAILRLFCSASVVSAKAMARFKSSSSRLSLCNSKAWRDRFCAAAALFGCGDFGKGSSNLAAFASRAESSSAERLALAASS